MYNVNSLWYVYVSKKIMGWRNNMLGPGKKGWLTPAMLIWSDIPRLAIHFLFGELSRLSYFIFSFLYFILISLVTVNQSKLIN